MTGRDMSRDLSRPEPMSTPDCDLRGFEWMPFNAVDLLDSKLWLEGDGWECKAAISLICKSWRQVPAGSLPNSDTALAQLACVPDWTHVRTMALQEWVLCSDGRLYHPIVAKKAMEALPSRQEYAHKKSAEAERKERERKDRKDLFAKLKAAGVTMEFNAKTKDLREAVAKLGAGKIPQSSAPPDRTGHAEKRDKSRDMSRLREGEGEREGLGIVEGGSPTPPSPPPPAPPAPAPAKKARAAKPPAPTADAWDAYSVAYEAKFGAAPVRNAKVNGQLANLVSRIPAAEVPDLIRHYLRQDDNLLYVRSGFALDPLLRDAEKLRTELVTRKRIGHTTTAQDQRSSRMREALGTPAPAPRPDSRTIDAEARHVGSHDHPHAPPRLPR